MEQSLIGFAGQYLLTSMDLEQLQNRVNKAILMRFCWTWTMDTLKVEYGYLLSQFINQIWFSFSLPTQKTGGIPKQRRYWIGSKAPKNITYLDHNRAILSRFMVINAVKQIAYKNEMKSQRNPIVATVDKKQIWNILFTA